MGIEMLNVPYFGIEDYLHVEGVLVIKGVPYPY
jgi:hypothetical protein